jgi:hypothetical protein
MEIVGLACLCSMSLVLAIVVPIVLIRKGFDLVFGCLGNIFVVVLAGILLVVTIVVTDVDICQVWLVGDPICSILNNF